MIFVSHVNLSWTPSCRLMYANNLLSLNKDSHILEIGFNIMSFTSGSYNMNTFHRELKSKIIRKEFNYA